MFTMDAFIPALGVYAFFLLFNLVSYTRSSTKTLKSDLIYTLILYPNDLFRTLIRWYILSRVNVNSYKELLLLWPLTIYETSLTQIMTDMHSSNSNDTDTPPPSITKTQLINCARTSTVEAFGVTLALKIMPQIAQLLPIPLDSLLKPAMDIPFSESLPTAKTILSLVLLIPLFDLGLDLGFYTFHRICHINKFLFKLVHQDHHVDTGLTHNRLVAYETYTITWIETLSIFGCYELGIG